MILRQSQLVKASLSLCFLAQKLPKARPFANPGRALKLEGTTSIKGDRPRRSLRMKSWLDYQNCFLMGEKRVNLILGSKPRGHL